MERNDFSRIRQYLGKSQNELAQLLCVSPKAIQSFEQGWRRIPASAERQILFLLASKMSKDGNISPCWETQKCPAEWRQKCAAWELKAGHFCWFINGTFCQGKLQESWEEKIELCRQCNVLKSMLPSLWNLFTSFPYFTSDNRRGSPSYKTRPVLISFDNRNIVLSGFRENFQLETILLQSFSQPDKSLLVESMFLHR